MNPTSNPYVWMSDFGKLFELKFNSNGVPRMVIYQGESPDLLHSEVDKLRADLEILKAQFENHVHTVPGGKPGPHNVGRHRRSHPTDPAWQSAHPAHPAPTEQGYQEPRPSVEATGTMTVPDPRLETITKHKP